ncbi:adenosine deaminase [Aeromicrobium senzhongii]|uniref:adenosine deaminase n=1 Tax=Aeromicrobium senzhongii TaxID=2663859 RepID=A0ABX6SU42_9ACTN|nr:adenosine deaminase [Aeromicrobium senzhongii]MTB88767.1 adenosine deaminase [Aeromicrobium senzhongii]QNL93939.1 adenosine deaminase [Aeromicrobium senzhongii]
MRATTEQIAAVPKVALHEHLDGGVRPETVAEIALEIGHELPAAPERLGAWFEEASSSGSLERYLETFQHTTAVMQRPEDLARVAREAVLDLAADGVVYAELRWAPEQHQGAGLSIEETVEAVQSGIDDGIAQVQAQGRTMVVGQLLTAMRHATRGLEIAKVAVEYRDRGVFGFDIAGAEDGFPPILHLEAFEYLRRENMHFTIHAGEAFGLPSIWQAVQRCGADRLGHGVRIVDDIDFTGTPRLGRLASYIRDRRIPLEMCPSSNLQTSAVPGMTSIADHPIGPLAELGFRVTINSDNRLMSGTSIGREMSLLTDAFGYSLGDLRWFTVNAMKSAFLPFDERLTLINDVIKPGFAAQVD